MFLVLLKVFYRNLKNIFLKKIPSGYHQFKGLSIESLNILYTWKNIKSKEISIYKIMLI
jgi:hypothetical protein